MQLPVPGNAVLFVEPETREGRVLAERYLSTGITEMPADAIAEAQALMSTPAVDVGTAAIRDGAWRVIRALTGQAEPSSVSDDRILRAVAYVNAHIDERLTLEEVAAQANLSPGRFRHLFVEQTGMALRPFMLWRRFLRVWDLLQSGDSLSRAAHKAGFADAAHLTRTSRRMFGIPPSAMASLAATLPGAGGDLRGNNPSDDAPDDKSPVSTPERAGTSGSGAPGRQSPPRLR